MKKHMTKIALTSITLVLLLLIVGQYVLTPIKVDGLSMSPTLENEQYVVLNKLAYLSKEADYGDIVIASNTSDDSGFIVKRIVGKPGDTIEFKHNILYRNGKVVTNVVLPKDGDSFSELTEVPENEYYLLGDNFNESVDSRVMGTFDSSDIFGKVVYK